MVELIKLDSSLSPMLGSLCWESHWNGTKGLSLELGEPFLRDVIGIQDLPGSYPNRRRRVYVVGSWGLWVYMAYWNISCNGIKLASSSSRISDIIIATKALKGQRLVDASINEVNGLSTFEFEFDTRLTVRRRSAHSTDELWVISGRDGKYRSVYGNGSYQSVESSGDRER